MRTRNLLTIAVFVSASGLFACSGGSSSGGSGTSGNGVTLSGTVSAPSGAIAFNGPRWTERLLAWVAGNSANAALSGTLPVGSGVTVNLIEIDADGNQVGAVIATGTTNASGGFSLQAPANFVAGAQYVVRAVGSTGNLDSIVSDANSTIAVDPVSEAAKRLVLVSMAGSGASLADLSTVSVNELQSQVDALSHATDTSLLGAPTATDLANAVLSESQSNQELANMASSLAASGVIRGRVTNATGAGLANIKVVARDFNNWVTRAQTRTNASGEYTLNVPPSPTQGYIIGAFNLTSNPAMSASEWYTATGGAPSPIGADRVKVISGTPVTANMQLENGTRLSGTVASDTGAPLPGVLVLLRDVATGFPVTWMHSRADGSYTLNAWPNRSYTLSARNNTMQPYATGTYNGQATGGTTANGGALLQDGGTIITTSAGMAHNLNFELQAGNKIAGCVTEPPVPTPTATDPCAGAGTPVGGIAVRFYSNFADSTFDGFVESPRTNKQGRFRMWVKPGSYAVRARGQSSFPNVTSASTFLTFNAQVGIATVRVTSDGSTPVSQVKVQVLDVSKMSSTVLAAFKGFEPTNGDGTAEVYTDTPLNATRLVFLLDGDQNGMGSVVYNGPSPTALNLASGSNVTMSTDGTPTDLGTITLPVGYTLSGIISGGEGGLRTLQIRNGGTDATYRFVNTRSQGDGSYRIHLPVDTNYYGRICGAVPPAPGTCTAPFTGPMAMPAEDTTLNL